MDKRFENKVTFVTDAGSGITRTTALAFAKSGEQSSEAFVPMGRMADPGEMADAIL